MKWINKNADLIVVFVLIIISLNGLYGKYEHGVSVVLRNYIAYLALLTVIVLRILRVPNIKIVLGIILISGTFNALQFTHENVFVSFYLGKLPVFGFQPVSFYSLIGLVVLDLKGAVEFVRTLAPERVEKKKNENESDSDRTMIDGYKKRFQNFSKEKLEGIVNNPGSYQYAAVEAARELLNNKA